MKTDGVSGGGRLNCRVYPNGEFSVWQERLSPPEPPTAQPDYLGLSILPNSHRQLIGLTGPTPNRAQRGLSGITRLGARTVRNGAFCLEKSGGQSTWVSSPVHCRLLGAMSSTREESGLKLSGYSSRV